MELPDSSSSEDVAIIGMAYTLPGSGDNEDNFWTFLLEGKCAVNSPPSHRWPTAAFPEATEEHRSNPASYISKPIDEFDASFFGMSPYEAELADPQLRFMLEHTWHALEDAGIPPSFLYGTNTGIFTGTWTYHYLESLISKKPDLDFIRRYLGNGIGPQAGKIAHVLGTTGPVVALEAGCAAVSCAIGLAMTSLRTRETNLSIVATANILSKPFQNSEAAGIVSPEGWSKTFDKNADGFGRGEGCVVFVLKRLADAIGNGDKVYCVLKGFGQAQEGLSKSVGTPTVEGEALAMQRALANAGVNPDNISYVEMHGTGTPVGDPIEVAALARAYGGRKEPLIIGSVKPNIGHTEGSSGAAGLIKVILAMKHGIIPPHTGCREINPNVNLESVPAFAPMQPVSWQRNKEGKLMAGISSFGISGTNTHIIVENFPKQNCPVSAITEVNATHKPLPYLLPLSAKSEISLESLIRSYSISLPQRAEDVANVTYSAACGRSHLRPFRATAIGHNSLELRRNMGTLEKVECGVTPPKICFLFAGQGNHYSGMGKELYDTYPLFHQEMDGCFKILEDEGINLREVLWGNEEVEELANNHSDLVHIGALCIQYANFKLWESWGVKPDVVLGHSMGEIIAFLAAGVVNIQNTLKYMVKRATFTSSLKGKMVAIKATLEIAGELINEVQKRGHWLDTCCYNSTNQHVLGGTESGITCLLELCGERNIKATVINDSVALHTRLVDAVKEPLLSAAQNMTISPKACEIISAARGTLLRDEDLTTSYSFENLRSPVQFTSACKQVQDLSATMFVEFSPQPVLCGLVRENLEEISNVVFVPTMRRNQNALNTYADALKSLYLGGVDVDWNQVYAGHNYLKVDIPLYPFQRKKYHFTPSNNRLVNYRKALHPLLGDIIRQPTGHTLFVSHVLPTKDLAFLEDHRIGKHVILPAAGYVEMMLAAFHFHKASIGKGSLNPQIPMCIQDLLIQAPLHLSLEKETEIQTVFEESGVISIYTKNATSSSPWKQHAKATVTFSSCNAPEQKKKHLCPPSEDEWEPQCSSGLYATLDQLGYSFGPGFKSLSRIWTRNNNRAKEETICEVKLPWNKNYVCHPILLDAVIQATLVAREGFPSKLLVPVSVDKLTWFIAPKSQKDHFFVHVEETNSIWVSQLLDSEGFIILEAEGISFAETSIAKLSSALDPTLPPMYVNEWICTGSLPGFQQGKGYTFDAIGLTQRMEENSDPDFDVLLPLVDESVVPLLIKALLDWPWPYNPGEIVSSENICRDIGVVDERKGKILKSFLSMLVEDGYLGEVKEDTFIVNKAFPNRDRLDEVLQNLKPPVFMVEYELLVRCMPRFLGVLRGKDSVLSVLFPGNENIQVSAKTLYHDSVFSRQYNQLFCMSMENVLKFHQGSELNILEIGAGTGSATILVLEVLKNMNIQFKYLYTDISSAFFADARENLKSYQTIEYKMLDIEADPLLQGYAPFSFDIIIASNVIHATKNIVNTLRNCKVLLNDGGIVINVEHMKPFRFGDGTWGLLDGYWNFEDYELRDSRCLLSPCKWQHAFDTAGYENVSVATCGDEYAGCVFGRSSTTSQLIPSVNDGIKQWLFIGHSSSSPFVKELRELLSHCGRSVILREDGNDLSGYVGQHFEGIVFLLGLEAEVTQEILVKDFLQLCQDLLLKMDAPFPKLIIPTRGAIYIGDEASETILPSSGSIWGMVRTLWNELPDMESKLIDICQDTQPLQLLKEMFGSFEERQVALREGRYILRMKDFKPSCPPLELPNSIRFSLQLPESKLIPDVKFMPLPEYNLQDDEVEVETRATGLNFKDILNVIKPSSEFEGKLVVGTDFAGIISKVGKNVKGWKIGDAVYGFTSKHFLFPSHISICSQLIAPLPPAWTFAEATTLPVAFCTAYHCLVTVGKLRKGDRVLIHTATGGVGHAAIQIAVGSGAEVFVTAGSKRKRAYLRKIFGLKNVYDSRSIRFSEEIMKDTEAFGVDVVLNSLTSPGYKEASLSCCARNARFIEISKLNVWNEDNVRNLRQDVTYDLVSLEWLSHSDLVQLVGDMHTWVENKGLRACPKTQYEVNEIHKAMMFLQTTKHVGKVVLVYPNSKLENGSITRRFPMWNDRSSYLITGGLGGIGLEIAKFMVSNGARNIILVGRGGPSPEAQEKVSELMKEYAANIIVHQADVGNISDCGELLTIVSTKCLPPLRGIMHAAGTLLDATLQNQTWVKMDHCFHPKVDGAWNLHKLTLQAGIFLEHFVCFSSWASLVGSPGQANHAAANAYLDSFVNYRRSLGLSALSVNWGQWGEVGIVADKEVKFTRPFTPTQAVAALQVALKDHVGQCAVFEGDIESMAPPGSWRGKYMENLKLEKPEISSTKIHDKKVTPEEFWREIEKAGSTGTNLENVVTSFVSRIVRNLLKLAENDNLDVKQNLQSIGMDSLMFVELRNTIRTMLGDKVTICRNELDDCNTIAELGMKISRCVSKNE